MQEAEVCETSRQAGSELFIHNNLAQCIASELFFALTAPKLINDPGLREVIAWRGLQFSRVAGWLPPDASGHQHLNFGQRSERLDSIINIKGEDYDYRVIQTAL